MYPLIFCFDSLLPQIIKKDSHRHCHCYIAVHVFLFIQDTIFFKNIACDSVARCCPEFLLVNTRPQKDVKKKESEINRISQREIILLHVKALKARCRFIYPGRGISVRERFNSKDEKLQHKIKKQRKKEKQKTRQRI